MRFATVLFLIGIASPAFGQFPQQWFFNPKPDDFDRDAFLDLRSLNEMVAGESGFIAVSQDGDFVDGRGKPIRFWGINTNVYEALPQYSSHPPRDLDRHARWLAKRGINMVRWHGSAYPNAGAKGGASDNPAEVNRKSLDGVWRLVASMKKQGIYTTVSPYWAADLKIPAKWGVGGPDKLDAHGVLFFNPKMQEIYKGWLKTLFAEKNPHTGIPLKDDPAVAIIQIQNEDSLLFWTFGGLHAEQKAILGKQFGAWAAKRYGSFDKAKQAWNAALKDDDSAKEIFGLYGSWDLTRGAPKWDANKSKRLADQLEFLTETMRAFNQSIVDYLRNDLGCKQVVNCGNWRSADPFLLDDCERYSYGPGEVVGVNHYFSPPHLGEHRGWAVVAKDTYQNLSILQEPRELPVSLKQTRGKAMILPESAWVTPNEYQAEGAFLAAAYQSLSGVDCFYWFATSTTEWMPPTSANGFMKDSIGKWVVATPTQLGQFPAAAFLFRNALVKKGTPAVVEHRPLADMWNRKPPLIAEDPGYDPNRDTGDTAKKAGVTAVNPLAYLVGPVEVVYGSDSKNTIVADLKPYLDEVKKTVTSNTGELQLDWKRQIATIDAPSAQGVCGFLKNAGGTFQTKTLSIRSENEYAAVLVVALDGKPLAETEKAIVQVGTRCRPSGWQERSAGVTVEGKKPFAGKEVLKVGESRWAVEITQVTLEIANPAFASAVLLDENFNVVRNLDGVRKSGKFTLQIPREAMYVGLRK
jgi:hypothetical protein